MAPVGELQGQSGPVKTTLSQYEYKLVYFGTPFYFANISAPQNHTEMILYSEFTDGSQFSKEKNGLKIFFSVAQKIKKQLKIEIIHFLQDTLY